MITFVPFNAATTESSTGSSSQSQGVVAIVLPIVLILVGVVAIAVVLAVLVFVWIRGRRRETYASPSPAPEGKLSTYMVTAEQEVFGNDDKLREKELDKLREKELESGAWGGGARGVGGSLFGDPSGRESVIDYLTDELPIQLQNGIPIQEVNVTF